MEQFACMESSERERPAFVAFERRFVRLVRQVLELAVPPVMLEHVSVQKILERIPGNYVAAVVGWELGL